MNKELDGINFYTRYYFGNDNDKEMDGTKFILNGEKVTMDEMQQGIDKIYKDKSPIAKTTLDVAEKYLNDLKEKFWNNSNAFSLYRMVRQLERVIELRTKKLIKDHCE